MIFPSLSSIYMLRDSESRSISAENPDGRRGGGAREDPRGEGPASNLGRGWKVRPCITLGAGETVTLADIDGPGVVQHIWLTVDIEAYRNTVLRMYWDKEAAPSVEVPLGDFFANGHRIRHLVNSLPIAVNPSGGFNSYWPMPFRRHCKITIENEHTQDINGFYYQVDYALETVPDDAVYFHAQWRRSTTQREHPEHVILDSVAGRGQYVGTYLAWTQLSDGWWGEGEIKFFLDGDTTGPTICGTGTEDYFGGAWCFGDTYSTPYLGYPLHKKDEGTVPKHSLYRWHIQDPIRFREDLRVTIQALGWWPNSKFQPLADDIASVAYWYQSEPHGEFPELPSVTDRFPR